jgi:hypothetical protein
MAAQIQDPNGPPLGACELIAQADLAEAKILKTIKDIKGTLAKAAKLMQSILYGGIDIVETVGAEMASAIPIAASAIANTLLTGVSKAVNNILETILSQILMILLAFPNAIFSLVAMPLERAIAAGLSERRYLSKAKNNLIAVNNIIGQWTTNIGGAEYYNKMIAAMPYINKILTLIRQMLDQLGGTVQNIDVENIVFDQSKYDSLRGQLRQVISITQPAPSLDNTAQFTQSITDELARQKSIQLNVIETKYEDQKKILDLEYIKKMSVMDMKNHNLTNQLAITAIKLSWVTSIKNLQSNKEIEIDLVNDNINYQQVMQVISAQEVNLYNTFMQQVNVVANYLANFIDNIKNAYEQNLQCQTYCMTVYNSRSLIQQLIKEMISLLRQTGSASAQVASTALASAQSLVMTTRDLYQKNIDEYKSQFTGTGKSSAASQSIALSTGNILLETADAALTSLITDSLIKLLESGDLLQSGSNDFDAFCARLRKIPDWKNGTGSWIVNLIGGITINSYIQLIADATQLVVMIPILSLSKQPEDHNNLSNLMSAVDDGYNQILTHNGLVVTILQSYIPYQSPECAVLQRLLNRLGVFNAFTTTLSVSVIVNEFLKMMPNLNANPIEPNTENCRLFYPDLFDDPDVVAAYYQQEANKIPCECDLLYQPTLEQVDPSVIQAARNWGFKSHIGDLAFGPTESSYILNPYSGFSPLTSGTK